MIGRPEGKLYQKKGHHRRPRRATLGDSFKRSIMSIKTRNPGLAIIMTSLIWVSPLFGAQNESVGSLSGVTEIQCTFPLMSVGTWTDDEIEAEVGPADLELRFEDINADEGSAQLAGGFGTYSIIVRYAGGYLHFIQSFLSGPLYVTTILEKETSNGTLKAMHSRHEFTDFAVPGFTSSPEQYYGECNR